LWTGQATDRGRSIEIKIKNTVGNKPPENNIRMLLEFRVFVWGLFLFAFFALFVFLRGLFLAVFLILEFGVLSLALSTNFSFIYRVLILSTYSIRLSPLCRHHSP